MALTSHTAQSVANEAEATLVGHVQTLEVSASMTQSASPTKSDRQSLESASLSAVPSILPSLESSHIPTELEPNKATKTYVHDEYSR